MASRGKEKAGVHNTSSQAGQYSLQSEESRKPTADHLKSDDMRSICTKSFAGTHGNVQFMQTPFNTVEGGIQSKTWSAKSGVTFTSYVEPSFLRSEESRKPVVDSLKSDNFSASTSGSTKQTQISPKTVGSKSLFAKSEKCTSSNISEGTTFVSPHEGSVTERFPMDGVLRRFSSDIEKSLNESHSAVSVKIERNDENAICVLEGAPDDVKKAKLKLQAMVKSLCKREVIFPTNTSSALADIFIEDVVNDMLKDKYPSCVAQQLENKIFLCGFDKEVLNKAKTFFSTTIEVKNNLLCGRLRELKDFVVDYFKSKHKNQIAVYVDNACRLHMIGQKKVVAEAVGELIEFNEGRKSFSPQNTISSTPKEATELIGPLEPGHYRVLEKSGKLEQVSDHYKVSVCIQEKDNTVRIKGSHENVSQAAKDLHLRQKNIFTDWRDISSPKSVKYFTSNEGDKYVDTMQEKFDVLIEKKLIFSCGKQRVIKEVHKDCSSWSKGKKQSEEKKLAVKMLSFEHSTADLIFIPTRSDPNKGGRFKAKQNNIVEMVIPDMASGGQKDFENVEIVLHKALEKAAASSNVTSVAFRLSPVANWDFGSLMKCMVDTFVKWFLTAIPGMPISVLLCTEMRENFRSTDEYTDTYIRTTLEDARQQPEINIVKGRLDQADADVIVNTAAWNLNLSYGKVSSALLKAAGQELQNECSKCHPNGIKYDEVAVTRGYRLYCQRVFHITLQTQDKSSAGLMQRIRDAMLRCLKTASDYGYKSIAFPALGTGSLNYPLEEVASEMIMSVERFSSQHPGWISIREVRFVIFPKDESLFQIFQKMKEELVKPQLPVKSELGPVVRFGITGAEQAVISCKARLDSKDKRIANATVTDMSGSTSGHNRSCSLARHSAEDRSYFCGKISVKVYEANILDVSVDCVVNPANTNLDNCGGLAHIIAKAAGECFYKECAELIKENGPLTVKSVVRTSAGNLQHCKCVLHAVGPDYTDYMPFTKTTLGTCEHDLFETVLNSLYQASELNFQTVALPTMSSGVYIVPDEVRKICAIQYAKAIKEFSSTRLSLQEIHVVDESRDVIDIYHKAFDAIIKNGKPAPFDTAKFIVASGNRNREAKIKNTARDRPTPVTGVAACNINPDTKLKFVHASYRNNSQMLECKLCADVKLDVQVYESDIVNLEDIDAVVCSENRAGGAKGIVARLLLQKGGEEYRQDKASKFYSQPSFGDIITTRAGGNTYSYIIHAIISRKDSNAITLMYSQIFKEVEAKGFTSVAVPLLGTGVGDVDPRSSSEMLFEQLIQFCQTNSKHSFTLHVVLNDKPVADVVKDVFKRRIDDMKQEPKEDIKGRDSKHFEDKTLPTGSGAAALQEKAEAEGDCVICMDKITDAKKLQCGHVFCCECIEGYFRVKKVCPTCGKVCGTITGDQPDGKMEIIKQPSSVAGFEKYKSIAIVYTFGHGTQGPDHPRPGSGYKGIRRTAYLPDNKEGRQICAMLKVAFERRLVFTIGTSRTTGKECVITWNDIHHKTDMRPNTQFGYPDETYLQRVREELEAKGVSLQDVEKEFMKKLKADNFREIIATDTRL